MSKRLKIVITLILVAGLSASYLFWLVKQEYRPSHLVKRAEQFIIFLQNQELDKAHDMTLKNVLIGSDLTSFKSFVARQWWDTKNHEIAKLEINTVRTGQTYGNRIRRWITGRPIEVDQISVDFVVYGKPNGLILFEVRFARTGPKSWKISYFQSHAG